MKLLAFLILFATPPAPLSFLHPNDIILFQGDSITDGGRERTGSDFNHIMGQDYAYILAAQLGADLPERNLTFLNRGVGGERVPDLAARWQDDTIALHPNILSILVGINDMLNTSKGVLTADEFEAQYAKLLADTIAALPHTKIVLGEPFELPVGKHKEPYAAESAELKRRQAIVTRLGEKYHLPVIHYQQVFDAALAKAPADHWSWDGIHPTYAGHALMAKEWLRVTSSAWDQK